VAWPQAVLGSASRDSV